MEPISTSIILLNIFLGAIVGFFTLITKDMKLLAAIQIFGLIAVFIQVWPYLTSISLSTTPDINSTANDIINLLTILVAYAVPNAAFSAGLSIFIKNP